MATFNQPNIIPTWCENNSTNTAQPPDSLRDSGWSAGEPVPAEYMNWLMNSYGDWIGYLNQANQSTVMASALDINMRLIGGGMWTYNSTTNTLSWDETAYLAMPTVDPTDNAIPAGSVSLGPNAVGYVTGNIPFSVTGGLTSGDTHLTGASTTTAIVVGQNVTGAGVPSGTTVAAINGSTVTLSKAATATNANAQLIFAGSGSLTMQSASVASLQPSGNTIVLAYGREQSAIVGANSGQMTVRDGERKRLLGTGYVNVIRLVAGVALTQGQACYVSTGNDGRTAGYAYPTDAGSTNGSQRALFVGFVLSSVASGSAALICCQGVFNNLNALSVGKVHYLDPTTVGGITATAPTTPGQFNVPVGLALSSTQLQLASDAGLALAAIQNGFTVNGPLNVNGQETIKPGVTGKTLTLYDSTGNNVVYTVDDTGSVAAASQTLSGTLNVKGQTTLLGAVNGPDALGSSITFNANLVGSSGVGVNFDYVNGKQITASTSCISPTFISGAGFKRNILLGGYTTTNFPGGSQQLVIDYQSASQARKVPMAFAGSVISVAASFSNQLNSGVGVAINLLVNGTQVATGNLTLNSLRTGGYTTFAKGTYKFAPGDIVSALVNFSTTGVNTSVQAEAVIESDA